MHAFASQNGALPFKMFARCHVPPISFFYTRFAISCLPDWCGKVCQWCVNADTMCKLPDLWVNCLPQDKLCHPIGLSKCTCRSSGLVASQGVLLDGAIVLLPSNTVCLLYETPPLCTLLLLIQLLQSPGPLSAQCAQCIFHIA